MFKTLLLTSYCVGSFQRPFVPRAGWLLMRGEDLLRTNNICLFYMLSAHVHLLFFETTYLLGHKSSPECHTVYTFVLRELFSPH